MNDRVVKNDAIEAVRVMAAKENWYPERFASIVDALRALPSATGEEEDEEQKEKELNAILVDLTKFMSGDEMDDESAMQIVTDYHRDRNRKKYNSERSVK